jgi:hypothetical protein
MNKLTLIATTATLLLGSASLGAAVAQGKMSGGNAGAPSGHGMEQGGPAAPSEGTSDGKMYQMDRADRSDRGDRDDKMKVLACPAVRDVVFAILPKKWVAVDALWATRVLGFRADRALCLSVLGMLPS